MSAPSSQIAYSGAGHTRRAARAALVALLADHDFGGRAALRQAYQPASADWPAVKAGPLVGPIAEDDPIDARWAGESAIDTRLAVMSTDIDSDLYLGGLGAEVYAAFSIDWSVITTGTLSAWCEPAFEHTLRQIGEILTTAQRNPPPAWIDITVGKVELMQFDIGDRAALSAAIPVELILDSDSLFG